MKRQVRIDLNSSAAARSASPAASTTNSTAAAGSASFLQLEEKTLTGERRQGTNERWQYSWSGQPTSLTYGDGNEEFADLDNATKLNVERALHTDPENAANLQYTRLHSGFCREITVTEEDINRVT